MTCEELKQKVIEYHICALNIKQIIKSALLKLSTLSTVKKHNLLVLANVCCHTAETTANHCKSVFF